MQFSRPPGCCQRHKLRAFAAMQASLSPFWPEWMWLVFPRFSIPLRYLTLFFVLLSLLRSFIVPPGKMGKNEQVLYLSFKVMKYVLIGSLFQYIFFTSVDLRILTRPQRWLLRAWRAICTVKWSQREPHMRSPNQSGTLIDGIEPNIMEVTLASFFQGY